MIGQAQEAPLEFTFFASEDSLHDGLEIVIDEVCRNAAEEGEGAIVRLQYHLLRLSQIGDDENLPTVGQSEMRDLDGLQHATQFDLLVAPVELAGIASDKQQRHKRLFQLGAVMA